MCPESYTNPNVRCLASSSLKSAQTVRVEESDGTNSDVTVLVEVHKGCRCACAINAGVRWSTNHIFFIISI